MLDYFYNRLLDHNKKIKLLVKKLESEVLLFKLPNFKYRQFRDQLILSEVQKSDIYAKNLVNSLMSRTVEINSRKEKISSIYVYRNTILVIFSFLTIFIIFSLIRILKMTKILITGCAGFIGFHLSKELSKKIRLSE